MVNVPINPWMACWNFRIYSSRTMCQKNSLAKILHTVCLKKHPVRPVPYGCADCMDFVRLYGQKKNLEFFFQKSPRKTCWKNLPSKLQILPWKTSCLPCWNCWNKRMILPWFLCLWNLQNSPSLSFSFSGNEITSNPCPLLLLALSFLKNLSCESEQKIQFASPQALFVHGNFLFQSNGLD